MSRLIVENRSRRSDAEALRLASDVVASGRISDNGKSYCYLTVTQGCQIAAFRNKASDRLVVLDARPQAAQEGRE